MKAKIFLTHEDVVDTINGWAARLELHPVYFRRRYKLYKNNPEKLFAKRLKTGPIVPLRGDKHPLYKHGLSHTKAHAVWNDMMTRCYNVDCSSFERYGGRGITVSKSWHNFLNFYEDMGNPPSGSTLDRVNNNAGYRKGNCRWATPKEQAANRRPRRKKGK